MRSGWLSGEKAAFDAGCPLWARSIYRDPAGEIYAAAIFFGMEPLVGLAAELDDIPMIM